MKRFLHHLFFPHELNNHRPKLLHYPTLAFFILFFFVTQFVFVKTEANFPMVLGTKTDISTQELLLLTNKERQDNKLTTLVLNDRLSLAAELKGENMFAKNYWAHNAPDGTTPWYFFKQVNYNYIYAGENLARGFTSSKDVVDAWMASLSHRENMLSPNYKDIGFAVIEGNLSGENTTLIVEMFGNTQAIPLAKKQENTHQQIPQTKQETSSSILPSSIVRSPFIDSHAFVLYVAVGTVGIFLFVLIADMVIIERKKIVRVVGHNIDHVIFFTFILVFMLFIQKGMTL